MIKGATGESVGEAIFRSYALLNNAPGSDAVESSRSWKDRLVSNFLYLVGVITFAVIIGVVGDAIGTNVEALRTSNGRVLTSRHTVLVNWNEHTRPMLRQLEAARREGRLTGPVVLIADRQKTDMDADVADELAKVGSSGLHVLTREGGTTKLGNLDRVAVGTAKRLIMVPESTSEDGSDPGPMLEKSTSIASALQQNVFKHQNKRANVVVSVPAGYETELGQQEAACTDLPTNTIVGDRQLIHF